MTTCHDILEEIYDLLQGSSLRSIIKSGSSSDEMQIVNGAASVSNFTVKESFTAVTTNVFTASGNRYGFEIWNQGTSNLTFTINSITITVAPNATYSNEFDAFTEVTLSSGAVFEAHTLGVRS